MSLPLNLQKEDWRFAAMPYLFNWARQAYEARMESLDILSDLLYRIPLRVYADKDRLHLLSSPLLCNQINRVTFS